MTMWLRTLAIDAINHLNGALSDWAESTVLAPP